MRIACEVMLDRNPDSPDAEPNAMAEYIDDEFMPAPGQVIFIADADGNECAYTVTSTMAWPEDMKPPMSEREMSAGTAGRHSTSQHGR